jgi:hypothetical protein
MILSVARKPAGGFQFITVRQLCAVWCAYQRKLIRLRDIRVWFAAQELVARRCQLARDRQPTYSDEELIQLAKGVGDIPASLYRLRACGLLTWEPHAITFPISTPEQLSSVVEPMLARITNHKRRVPVPRRLLRVLAADCTRVLLATVLGHLFRCLYYRDGHCQPEGLCKASWIAEVFGVSERAVKTARRRLEAIGFLLRTETPQWVLNRYGQKMTINLYWAGPPADATPQPASGPEIAPLSAALPNEIAPPDSYKRTLPEEKHQEPAASRPAGVLSTLFAQARECLHTATTLPTEPEPVILCRISAPMRGRQSRTPVQVPMPGAAPTLHHVTLQDLKETSRLLSLYAQGVQTKLIGPSEADRLTFMALAQHVLRYVPENPGGLFLQLLRQRRFHFITQDEEDTARRKLLEHMYKEPPRSVLAVAA